MAAADLALHRRPARCAPRRRVTRHPHMARVPAQISRASSRVARRSRRRTTNRRQGRGVRAPRVRTVLPRVLSRTAHAVLAGGTRTRPAVTRVCLAQPRSNNNRRRNRRHALDDALDPSCGDDRRQRHAASACRQRDLNETGNQYCSTQKQLYFLRRLYVTCETPVIFPSLSMRMYSLLIWLLSSDNVLITTWYTTPSRLL